MQRTKAYEKVSILTYQGNANQKDSETVFYGSVTGICQKRP